MEGTHGDGGSESERDAKVPRALHRPHSRLRDGRALQRAADAQLLDDERDAEEDRKGPADDAGDGVGDDGERDALPAALDRRQARRGAEHDEVHGERRGEERGRRRVEGGREHLDPQDVAADVRADVDMARPVEDGLDERRERGEHEPRAEEDDALHDRRATVSNCLALRRRKGETRTHLVGEANGAKGDGRARVDEEVEVRPDRVHGRVLPGLEASPGHEVVQRLPVVEDCERERRESAQGPVPRERQRAGGG